jgi:hypothetical protein
MWQVIFIEMDNGSYLAFCPYTKLWTYGANIQEATMNWNIKMNQLGKDEMILHETLKYMKIFCHVDDDAEYFRFEYPELFTLKINKNKLGQPKDISISNMYCIDSGSDIWMDFKFRCTSIH